MSLNSNHPVDDDKMNSYFHQLQNRYKNTIDSSGKNVSQISHNAPTSGTNPTGPMRGNLMNWTQMLESMDDISDSIDNMENDIGETNIEDSNNQPNIEPNNDMNDIMNSNIDNTDNSDTELNDTKVQSGNINEDELLNELNQIFTPILVMQGFEGDIADKINEAFSEASVLMERNIISFDNKSRMAQLISVCALLIARQKNSEKYQLYHKAAIVKNKMKLDIQKEEYDAAKTLAQKFLVKVSTTNTSSIARNAANELLPETQH